MMPASVRAAESLAQKLTVFRQLLQPAEQKALDDLMETFAVQVGASRALRRVLVPPAQAWLSYRRRPKP